MQLAVKERFVFFVTYFIFELFTNNPTRTAITRNGIGVTENKKLKYIYTYYFPYFHRKYLFEHKICQLFSKESLRYK